MTMRSKCDCPCHQNVAMMHFVACCTTRCTAPATVCQQMKHVVRLRKMYAERVGFKAERYLCAEHADLIDRDWITAEHLDGWPAGQVCEYEEEEPE